MTENSNAGEISALKAAKSGFVILSFDRLFIFNLPFMARVLL